MSYFNCKRGALRFFVVALVVFGIALAVPVQAATSSLTASETVANVAKATNSTYASISTTTANVAEVKATTTLTVVAVPAAAETLTIGTCVITFQVAASSTAGVRCIGGTMNLDIGAGDNATTTAGLAATLSVLSHVTATSGATTTSLSFSRGSTTLAVAIQTSASTTEIGGRIKITDGTTGDIIVSNSRAGVAPVAQIDEITLSGSPDEDDTYTIATTTGSYSTTTTATDTTLRLITDRIWQTISEEPNYATAGFTVSTTTGNKVVLTASVSGTAFSASASTNAGIAQQITFTPATITSGEVFKISINSRDYSYTAAGSDGVAQVVAGLVTGNADADPIATCVNTANTTVTCTAKTAGTAFTSYASSVTGVTVISSGSGGSAVFASSPVVKAPTVVFTPTNANTFKFTQSMDLGSRGSQVRALQDKLIAEGFLSAKATGYFGQATVAAVKAYQKAHGIRAIGMVGPATRAELNKPSDDARNQLIMQIQSLMQQIKDLQAQMKK